MKVEVVKVLVLLALFAMTFLFGILPILLRRVFKARSENLHRQLVYKRTLSFLSCFAAGVFLATGLLDLLPSARVNLTKVMNNKSIFSSFPVSEFVMMIGFFIILIVEQVVLTVKESNLSEMDEGTPDSEADVRTPLLKSSNRLSAYTRSYSVTSEHSITGISDDPCQSGSFSSSGAHHQPHNNNRVQGPSNADDTDIRSEEQAAMDVPPEHEHSSLRSLLLITALSLHSVFEGLAVGLQGNTDDVLGIFSALVLHKSILSFSLGMNLIQSKLSRAGVLRSIVFFSLTAPVGVAVGIGIVDLWDSSTSTLLQGLLTGIACGTFLFVTFFEVLPCEFNSEDQRLLKVVFLLIGFSAVTGVLFLHSDDTLTCSVVPK